VWELAPERSGGVGVWQYGSVGEGSCACLMGATNEEE
jgi:hypothetical protein